jgi:hypothetical protein
MGSGPVYFILALAWIGMLVVLATVLHILLPVVHTRRIMKAKYDGHLWPEDIDDSGRIFADAHDNVTDIMEAEFVLQSQEIRSRSFVKSLNYPRFTLFPDRLYDLLLRDLLVRAEHSVAGPVILVSVLNEMLKRTPSKPERQVLEELRARSANAGSWGRRQLYSIYLWPLLIFATILCSAYVCLSYQPDRSPLYQAFIVIPFALVGSFYSGLTVAHAFSRLYLIRNQSTARSAHLNVGALSEVNQCLVQFVTDGVSVRPLLAWKRPSPEACVWSMGDPHNSAPSTFLWGRARFELHIYFSIWNRGSMHATLVDVRSRLYEVSPFRRPLACVVHRARIELLQGNSILPTGRTYRIDPGQNLDIDLVFETSVFDTMFTTLVFGVIANVRYAGGDGVSGVAEIPSDHIYVFQHDCEWKGKKAHFVSMTGTSLEARALSEPDNAEVQEFCAALKTTLERHRNVVSGN